MKIKAVDLFCGAGGLTYGLQRAGIDVVAGVDVDPSCKYPFETNNSADFINKGVQTLKSADLAALVKGADVTALVGCAPCQPFSTYTQARSAGEDKKWELLDKFAELVRDMKPDLVSMENVCRLASKSVFKRFLGHLEEYGYSVDYWSVDCRKYGLPQSRRRLVLLASLHGKCGFPEVSHKKRDDWATVRETIAHMAALEAGQTDASDPLHTCSKLSELNLERIRASKPGGTWRDWPKELVAACHQEETGKTYPAVYGRMEWDKPSPTITGQCFGFGNGRFGHPQQDRAMSLREAALLQTFPETYQFVKEGDPIHMKQVGRHIGNAVPPQLGNLIGKAMNSHASAW